MVEASVIVSLPITTCVSSGPNETGTPIIVVATPGFSVSPLGSAMSSVAVGAGAKGIVFVPSMTTTLSEGDSEIGTPSTVVADPGWSVSLFGRTMPEPDGRTEKPLGSSGESVGAGAGARGMVLLPPITMKLADGASDT